MSHLDLAVFADAGNVARRPRDLNLDKQSYGAGLRLHTRRDTFAMLDVAQRQRRLDGRVPIARSVAAWPMTQDDGRAVCAVVRRVMIMRGVNDWYCGAERPQRRRAPASSRPQAQTAPSPAAASLWVEPSDLDSRDLFSGPWGAEHAPDPDGVYKLVERKHAGVNLGLTVKDAQRPRVEREAALSRAASIPRAR